MTRLRRPFPIFPSRPSVFRDHRGGVSAEYAILLGVVAVVCTAAIVVAGAPLVRGFLVRQAWLLLPVP